MIDRPAFCDFAFGAIVNRSPLVIGISTDGAAPVFGQAIRAKIEALIPKGFARWAEAARSWRPRVQALALSFRGRRNLLGEIRRARRRRARQRADRIRFRRVADAGRPRRGGLRYFGRRRSRRSGIVDAARRARAAIGRRDSVRSSGVAGDPRFRAPRSKEDAGRQNRARAVMQTGRHQRADGVAGQSRTPRGALEGRRPDDLRPRRRRDRRLPRRRHRRVEVVPGVTAAQAAASG